MSVEIDTGVPVPDKANLLNTMRKLQPGESFTATVGDRTKLQTYASKLKRDEGQSYTIRKEGELIRVWRTDG